MESVNILHFVHRAANSRVTAEYLFTHETSQRQQLEELIDLREHSRVLGRGRVVIQSAAALIEEAIVLVNKRVLMRPPQQVQVITVAHLQSHQ